ncbi:MAG: hypothetical protein WA210_06310 [Burkholderiaceae bacterium]
MRTLTILAVTIRGIGPDMSQGGKRWHHPFHFTPDLPEALVQGREREYLSWPPVVAAVVGVVEPGDRLAKNGANLVAPVVERRSFCA